jgi:hypothetical protein
MELLCFDIFSGENGGELVKLYKIRIDLCLDSVTKPRRCVATSLGYVSEGFLFLLLSPQSDAAAAAGDGHPANDSGMVGDGAGLRPHPTQVTAQMTFGIDPNAAAAQPTSVSSLDFTTLRPGQ